MKNELAEKEDFYFDESGYMVLTEKYLLKQEACCGNGCRHCPYNYENVQELQRQQLLDSKKINIENKK